MMLSILRPLCAMNCKYSNRSSFDNLYSLFIAIPLNENCRWVTYQTRCG